MKFTFSEQSDSTSDRSERGNKPSPESGIDEKTLERLKDDAEAFGWEFDEAKHVFTPKSVFG